MSVFLRGALILGLVVMFLGAALTQLVSTRTFSFEAKPHVQAYEQVSLISGDQVVFPLIDNETGPTNLMGIMPKASWVSLQIAEQNRNFSLQMLSSNFTNFEVTAYNGAVYSVVDAGQYIVWGENARSVGQTFAFSVNEKTFQTFGMELMWFGGGGLLFGVLPALPKLRSNKPRGESTRRSVPESVPEILKTRKDNICWKNEGGRV